MPLENMRKVANFVKDQRKLKDLISYIKKLDEEKINLEDLVDIIDDAAQETDAYVQQLIPSRDVLRLRSSMKHGRVGTMLETLYEKDL